MRLLVVLAGALACVGSAGVARACGVSAAGVASCSLAEHLEEVRPRWVVGANGLFTSTRLRFSGGLRAEERRAAALALVAYVPSREWVLQAGAGAALGGSLELAEGRLDFSPGPLFALGADWRLLDDGRWFGLLTSLLSVSLAWTEGAREPRTGYQAVDVRLGGQFGVDLGGLARPYLAARVFGGPVFWRYAERDVTGTDTHHYQLGAGLGVRVTRDLHVFAEVVPLGEQALSGGVGWSF
jgi:hypothetical protein